MAAVPSSLPVRTHLLSPLKKTLSLSLSSSLSPSLSPSSTNQTSCAGNSGLSHNNIHFDSEATLRLSNCEEGLVDSSRLLMSSIHVPKIQPKPSNATSIDIHETSESKVGVSSNNTNSGSSRGGGGGGGSSFSLAIEGFFSSAKAYLGSESSSKKM
jgi:hypothetical protein